MATQLDLIQGSLGRAWWLILLRGIAAIAFGVLALAWPGVTIVVLVVFYGVYAVLDGVLALAAALRGGGLAPRWWLVLAGAASLAAGAVALIWPALTILVLAVIIGVALIVRGVLEVIGAIQLRKTIRNEWVLILSGAVSVLFGFAVLAAPVLGVLALVWLIGLTAILLGGLLVFLSLRLRKLKDDNLTAAI